MYLVDTLSWRQFRDINGVVPLMRLGADAGRADRRNEGNR
jgi:hypothetical protein